MDEVRTLPLTPQRVAQKANLSHGLSATAELLVLLHSMSVVNSHGMSYAISSNVKSYHCEDYATNHAIIVCISSLISFSIYCH